MRSLRRPPKRASDAFELYAFDYLVKPFSIERVNRTLDRIAETGSPRAAEHDERVVKSEYRRDKLLVKGKESMSFVDIPEIIGFFTILKQENTKNLKSLM